MKKALPIVFLLVFCTGASYAVEVASFNLPREVESGIGPFGIGVHSSSGKKVAPGVYEYRGKVAFGYPDYDVKVLANCKSGLYKIIVLRPIQVVDGYSNVEQSGYEEVDLGWERLRLSGETREGLCSQWKGLSPQPPKIVNK